VIGWKHLGRARSGSIVGLVVRRVALLDICMSINEERARDTVDIERCIYTRVIAGIDDDKES